MFVFRLFLFLDVQTLNSEWTVQTRRHQRRFARPYRRCDSKEYTLAFQNRSERGREEKRTFALYLTQATENK